MTDKSPEDMMIELINNHSDEKLTEEQMQDVRDAMQLTSDIIMGMLECGVVKNL